jgi:hypothetical protein
MYEEAMVDYTHPSLGDFTETYNRNALFIGLGVDFSF